MGEITKEEIAALVESNIKVSNALQLIVSRLEGCSADLKEILDILLARQKQFTMIENLVIMVEKIKDNMTKLMILYGGLAFIIAVVTVIMQLIEGH